MTDRAVSETNRLGDFLQAELDYNLSRDVVTLKSGEDLAAGTVLGAISTGTAGTVAAGGSNTGTGACTKDGTTPVLAGAKIGTYIIRCILAATDKGLFEVIDPFGACIGLVNVGDTFAREIKFAIADATDFVAGDYFTFPVTAVTAKYVAHDTTAADGSQHAAAVLINDEDATGGDLSVAVIKRDAILKSGGLTWETSITATNLAIAKARLLAVNNIKVLTSAG